MSINAGTVYSELVLNTSKYEAGLNAAEKKMKSFGKGMENMGKSMQKYVTLPILAAGTASTKFAIDYESAFAGVRKTVDTTEEKFAELSEGIRAMSREIPASAVEIAGVVEAAGQLGIQTDNILGFTRVMIDLGEATNLSADEAATALARFANITQMSQGDFDRLGSTIVALGNNLATTEAEIVSMGMRLAGAGTQIGLTEAQTMGLAGALSSVGIEAEAGGSAFSRLMVDMQLAVETGSNQLDNFALVANMTRDQFVQAFKEDAAGALIAFIEGLSTTEERGASAIKVLDDMGISEIRLRDALLRASGASEVFAGAIDLGSEAWEQNIALTKEAEQRYQTTAAQLEISKNQLKEAGMIIGEIVVPRILELSNRVRGLAEWFRNLNPETQESIVKMAGLAALIGPIVLGLGKMTSAISPLIGLLGKYVIAAKTAETVTISATAAAKGLGLAAATLAGKIALVTGAIWLFYEATQDAKKGQDSLGAASGILGYNMQNLKRDIDNINTSLKQQTVEYQRVAAYQAMTQKSVENYTDSIEAQRLKGQQAIQQQETAKRKLQELEDAFNKAREAVDLTSTGIEDNTKALEKNAEEMKNAAEAAQELENKLKLVYGAYRKIDASPKSIVSKYMADYINRTGDISVAFNARGTNYWRGGWTWVGEEGPELMRLPAGTQIIPSDRSMDMVMNAIASLNMGVARGTERSQPVRAGDIHQHITINSPAPLSASEIARKNLQISRQLAMEWGL